jgi:hypothetical protein
MKVGGDKSSRNNHHNPWHWEPNIESGGEEEEEEILHKGRTNIVAVP